MNRYSEALSVLFKARKVRETNTGNRMIGLLLMHDGNVTQAIPYLEKALISLPNDPLLLQNLGSAYIKTGRIQEGKDLLVQLQQINSQNRRN
jgi:Flp pilus assembly protein TadD